MENMEYAEELVREFLIFRGFTSTLQTYESELRADICKGFQVDKILDLIFSVYIPKFQAEKLVGLLSFFKQYLSSSSEAVLIGTLSKLEASILRYYIVHALQVGRRDRVVDFFAMRGNELLERSHDWTPWFAIPYIKNPHLDPEFRIYFSKEWFEAMQLSVRNFFCEIFNGSRLPALLKISSDANSTNNLKRDIGQLNLKLSQLQALLEEKEEQLSQLRSMEGSNDSSSILREEGIYALKDTPEVCTTINPQIGQTEFSQDSDVAGPSKIHSEFISFNHGDDLTSQLGELLGNGKTGDPSQIVHDSRQIENSEDVYVEEDFPEVKVEHQETFLGHTSPISRCRFSASGNNIASASLDGTVRIWTYDSSTPASRNATIYCGTEILSLDWECKSDRLLLIGTSDGCIKAWNVDAKRVVCDLNTTETFPSVLDVKCSPVEPIFVSAAASGRVGSNNLDNLGFASLTVWNMKTWKAMTVLPLGEDPPAITSLCFNHNGKILAASATDGMIHMFDMSCGLQITGWPAHDSSISSILFGPDETSIFSLGSDGKIFEWSLQNQGQIMWSRNCSRLRYPADLKYCRHEMALDGSGRRLLVTSGSVRAPIYQVQGGRSGWRTLAHAASVTAVDWHPILPIFLTGSADNSVRVTSLR
ncbi:WD repeat-containing protein 91 isoform X2 [Neltuma alba]|uniref:WD repeat-containing protein 91 isoform X2 n=1 Tax=Neltuma alba TaxID=207710 RepID=UPI0010A442B8|nr:WD repeat-containing protein 91-like isoform X2 [Prosopis alba]